MGLPMISVYPSVDPAKVQAVVAHDSVWPGLQSEAPDPEVAVREYLTEPGCTFLLVERDGELMGGFAVDRISEVTAQGHNLIFGGEDYLTGAEKVEAFNHALCWVFGPLGYLRIQGRTHIENKAALRFATAMAGMTRCFTTDEEVYTALAFEDWPWRHAEWMTAATGGRPEYPGTVMGGLVARLAAVGAAARAVWAYNEFATSVDAQGMELVSADQTSALVRHAGRLVRVGVNGVQEMG